MGKTKVKTPKKSPEAVSKYFSKIGSAGAAGLKARLSKGKTPEQAEKAIKAHYRKISKSRSK